MADAGGTSGGGRVAGWGSDVVADALAALDIPYIALVPGASFRGFHDSLVNYLGPDGPQMIVCLHEEHAVAIAEGWARVTGRPMAVALHSNVGLMHGSMPIYNAWCDRTPVLIFGATGPVDAHERRPWIDWIHTSADQGALVRPFVKWDDQPGSAEAAVESVLRGYQIAATTPKGPVYICLDVGMQEASLQREVRVPDVARFAPGRPPAAAPDEVERAVDMLAAAHAPAVLMGRMSRDTADWQRRVAFAEALGAPVLTSIHRPPAFPATHPLHVLPVCGEWPSVAEADLIAGADLILSFDWLDLGGYLRGCIGTASTQKPPQARVIHVSLDHTMANGWSKDHYALPPADLALYADPDQVVGQLAAALGVRGCSAAAPLCPDALHNHTHWQSSVTPPASGADHAMSLELFAHTIAGFAASREVSFARLPIGWPGDACAFSHPLDYLGKDGGGAVGTGPGHSIGTALALKDSGRLVIGVVGDGDFLMGVNALWTAANLQVPVIFVVANNRAYFNDVRHQERMALTRNRPVENKWIGQVLDNPRPDIVRLAEAQGFAAEEVGTPDALIQALEAAELRFRAGQGTVIDARVGGY
ncbi:thiamine pyrophosphate-binding protein [Pseudoruegeria sp. HB172150]|uniref:thiamine pyrophosphate-binding protein n=1 Tax=Pseudoruegeria sp. HB172150 TaxID=2721164 RepID=UPI00155424F6|nr:thiamine pyrophosphate-binding protein [Pseudoruegeria sp. HB172150]